MSANALVQTRINSAIRDEAAAALAAMGLTVSDAVRMMLTKVAHDHVLPFDPLVPNAKTVAAMREARAGNLPSFDDNICHPTINVDRLDPECALPGLTINEPHVRQSVRYILNNSFGMLGINSVVIIGKV